MKFLIPTLIISIALMESCKPQQAATTNTAPLQVNQDAKVESVINEPQILFCQLMFYKALPVPKVSVVSMETVPGSLNFIRNENGPVNYKIFNNAEQLLAEGNIANPLYFKAESSDPATGQISASITYRDSAFKLIRIPYKEGMSLLKISFTDSLKKVHILKLTPITLKKS